MLDESSVISYSALSSYSAYIASVTSPQEPTDRNREDAGRNLRKMLLTTRPAELGIRPTQDYPRIWAVAMDWPIGEQIATIVSLCDGSASVYTTGTFGIIGGIAHESVRAAAKTFVKEADRYYDDSAATQNFSYPSVDRVRFSLVTFNGVRVTEADLGAARDGHSKYSRFSD